MKRLFQKIVEAGGRPLIVGGWVRDQVLGLDSKDIDVEVYNLSYSELAKVLSEFGKLDVVGESFGVIKLTTEDQDYDFSLPRLDSKNGVGHKGFSVETKSDLTPEEAAKRRDFTINSISFDPISKDYIDPYYGISDLDFGILRHTSSAFSEDPLRVLRGFQFCGRFALEGDYETIDLCYSLITEYNTLAKERIWGEWFKWATKSTKPSAGLEFLRETGWIELYPDIQKMIGIEQSPEWHPEGDVYQHTLHVCDAMADICKRQGIKGEKRAVLVLSALCHDMGKVYTTKVEESGKITAKNHAKIGVPFAASFLESIGCFRRIIDQVLPLVQEHMVTCGIRGKASDKTIRKLMYRLKSADMKDLELLIEADKSGRPPLQKGKCPIAVDMLERSKDMNIDRILKGQHLIDYFGLEPGPVFGEILEKVYICQLNGTVKSIDDAIHVVRSYGYKLQKPI